MLARRSSRSTPHRKLLRCFDDLGSTSSALSVDHAQGFETLAFNSSTIAGAVLKVRPLGRRDSHASSLTRLSSCAQLASDVQHYCAEVRSTKEPLQLTTLHGIAKDVAAVELGKQSPRPLDEINALLVQLAQNIGTTVTSAMEPEHVVKRASFSPLLFLVVSAPEDQKDADASLTLRAVSFEAPWLARVAELQSSAAINVDAERKVVQMQEEMRELVRDVRVKVRPRSPSCLTREPRSCLSSPCPLYRNKLTKRRRSRSSSWRSASRASRSRPRRSRSSRASSPRAASRSAPTRRRTRSSSATSTSSSRSSTSSSRARRRQRSRVRPSRSTFGAADGN